ncbi:hypothetical protein [Gordonia aquimaris]|uniref:Phosphoribosyltransferase n=1 Tax=Gordonia aquimaris TaxID=2984863 RepID=A0A9X3D935_9ACTN|nr:hypothetical protein [Gordonia aquimaris]MCX2966289.1 hypothetical protein [Gordonia aquimaris]
MKTERINPGGPDLATRMYLIADDASRYHLSHLFREQFEYAPRLEITSAGETLVLDWPYGVPEDAHRLVKVLLNHPAIPLAGLGNLNLAIALDRYKTIDTRLPASKWSNTRSGQAINDLKYQRQTPTAMLRLDPDFSYLANALSDVVRRHPAYSRASVVTSVPGANGTGVSLGEQLGRAVARKTGKPFVTALGPLRGPRKGDNPPDVTGTFSFEDQICGSCIVVDDVLWTGMSQNETARAARAVGATEVFGLAAAKTMRN